MKGFWVPPARERYTSDDLLTAAKSLGWRNIDKRAPKTFTELGLLDRPRRDWPGHGGSSSPGWWPRTQFDLWCTLIKQRQSIVAREGVKERISAALCNIVVAVWLYFGETSGIPLAQVRRAMRTWAKANSIVKSAEDANRQAMKFIKMARHSQAGDRLELREKLATMLRTGNYPNREELLYQMQMLVDPRGRGEFKGPAAAPIAAENLTDMILGRVEALKQLRGNQDEMPDGVWEWARFTVLWSRTDYQASQPKFAEDPSLQKHPELASMFKPDDFEGLVNVACENLLAVLALSDLARNAEHLPPELRPDIWLDGQMRLSVQSNQRPSDIVRPDGKRQEYLEMLIEADRKDRSSP